MKDQGLLRFGILILVLTVLIEGFFIMDLSRQERIVLIPLGIGEAGKSWVNEKNASPEYLEQMTLFLLPLVADFHPRNIEAQIPTFLRFVVPEQYGAVKTQLVSQAERAKRNDMAQAFYIQRVEVKEKTARATGIMRRFVGKSLTSEEVVTYEVQYEILSGRPFVRGIDLVSPTGAGASDRDRE
jgi:type IV conjugative transfer system protein TraE